MLLLEGLNRIRTLIADDIDYGQMGTATDAATESQTGLVTPDSNTLLTVSKTTSTSKTITFDYTLYSTGGSTATYTEFELRKNSTPVNYDRIVFTGISFTPNGTKDITVSKKYFIRSG